MLRILARPPVECSEQQRTDLLVYYQANLAPELKPDRDRLKKLKKQIASLKPDTVPIMRELAGAKRRKSLSAACAEAASPAASCASIHEIRYSGDSGLSATSPFQVAAALDAVLGTSTWNSDPQ